MNVFVRMRSSHALRFVPGVNWSRARMALTTVSWTRSSASAVLRVMRQLTPYSVSRWPRSSTSNESVRGTGPDERGASPAYVPRSWATELGFLLKKNGMGSRRRGEEPCLVPCPATGDRTRLFLLNAFPAGCIPRACAEPRLQLLDTLRQALHVGLELAEVAHPGQDRPDALVHGVLPLIERLLRALDDLGEARL